MSDAFERLLRGEIDADEYVADIERRVRERDFIQGRLGETWPHGILNTPGITQNSAGGPITEEALREAVDAVTSQENPTPAPNQEVEVSPISPAVKSKLPTRKWLAAQAVALGGVATSAVASGWDDTETNLLIGIVVGGIVTYLLPNQDTPGGVPVKPDPSL